MITFSEIGKRQILMGIKTMTARMRAKPGWKAGAVHWAQISRFKPESRFARIKILKVWEWNGRLDEVTEEIALKEGFETAFGFHRSYLKLNAHKRDNSKMKHYFIEFKVIKETHAN